MNRAWAVIFALVAVGAVLAVAGAQPASGPGGGLVSIPPDSFQVAGGTACYLTTAFGGGKPGKTLHLIDIPSGKAIAPGSPVADLSSCTLSSDGKQAILVGSNGLYLMNLQTLKPSRLTERVMRACWLGKRIVYATMEEESLRPLRVYNPADGKTEDWTTVGLPFAGDPTGKQLLAVVNPRAPDEPLAEKDMDTKVAMAVLDEKGKVIKELIGMGEVSSMPVVSPSFKYVAFQSRGKGAPGVRTTRYSVRVVGLEDKKIRTLEAGLPVAVTDTGRVVMTGMMFGEKGAPVKITDDDKSAELAEAALAATVTDGKVYCLTGDRAKPTVVSVDIPGERK